MTSCENIFFAITSCENKERSFGRHVYDFRMWKMSCVVQSIWASHDTHKADIVLFIRRIGGALIFQQSSQALATLTCCWMTGKATRIDVDDEQCVLASPSNPALHRISCHIV